MAVPRSSPRSHTLPAVLWSERAGEEACLRSLVLFSAHISHTVVTVLDYAEKSNHYRTQSTRLKSLIMMFLSQSKWLLLTLFGPVLSSSLRSVQLHFLFPPQNKVKTAACFSSGLIRLFSSAMGRTTLSSWGRKVNGCGAPSSWPCLLI